MSMSGDELKLPLRIDTSQVESDLRTVDAHLARLERRIVQTFNRLGSVRGGTAARAESLADVRKELSGLADPDLRSAMLSLRGPLQSYGARAAQLTAQAASGRGTLPPTAQQAAWARLGQVERQSQGRPQEITAKQKFFDDMVTSLRRGAPNVVGMAAGQSGIPGASRLAGTLMGLAEANPLVAGGLGAAVAVGAGALAVDANRASFQRQQAALSSALVGGPAFGDTRTLLGLGVMHAAQKMGASQEEGAGIAQQLASAGMRPGQLVGNLNNVLSLTHGYGLQAQDVIPIVQALGTAGGLTSSQIATVVRDLVDSTGKATGGLAQMTLGIKAWAAVSSGAARDPASLAAIQKVLGPTSGINAGQLTAPALGATGSQLVAGAAMLGMTPERLAHLQQTPGGAARIFAAEGTFLRQFPRDLTGQQLGLQALQERGMIDLSGLKSDQVERLGALWQRNPNLALRYYQGIRAQPTPPITPHIPEQTSKWDQFWMDFGNMFTQGANDPTHEGGPALAARSAALAMTGPVPGAPGGGGGKFGLHMVPAGLASQVAAAVTGGGRSGDATHTVKIEVTVRDQRGNQLGHRVDTTRVIAGANTTLRPPYDRPKGPALDNPQPPGRWNEGW